ncbi:MAG: galactitol-1-phosphate 5-dehydrogenase [Candidatus Hydrogenedentes bacterium]|nr:galactitol-1-phosphate 5-dehydrogenase [Candidatus Hydrogenedentota bacterium]
MKALVLTAPSTLEIQDVPKPHVSGDDVLVAVQACGICGSDVHGMDGSTGRRIPPIIMGHEAAGIIAAVGKDVPQWKTGDRVTFDSTIYCGACTFCKQDRVNLCEDRRVLGVSCDEYRQHGAFAEYVAVPGRILYRVPDGVPFEHAAMVEPISVALHAVTHASFVPNDCAVVIGAGMIGLLIVQALRVHSYNLIIAVDLDDSRLALATECGAHVTLNPSRIDVLTAVRARTRGLGADAVFEAVGANETVGAAIQCARKGGAVVLVGNVSANVQLPLQSVVTREISLFGSCASSGEYPTCLNLLQREHVRVAPLISAVASLDDGPEWFRRLHARERGLMKVILNPAK